MIIDQIECEYCKEDFNKNELTPFIENEFGCKDCIKELYGRFIK